MDHKKMETEVLHSRMNNMESTQVKKCARTCEPAMNRTGLEHVQRIDRTEPEDSPVRLHSRK